MSTATAELDRQTSPKAAVVDLLRRLPDNVSLDRILEEIRLSVVDDVGSDRSLAIEAIRRMPADATFEEIEDEVLLLIALREADEDIAAGRVIPHEEVMRMAASWSTQSSGPQEL